MMAAETLRFDFENGRSIQRNNLCMRRGLSVSRALILLASLSLAATEATCSLARYKHILNRSINTKHEIEFISLTVHTGSCRYVINAAKSLLAPLRKLVSARLLMKQPSEIFL